MSQEKFNDTMIRSEALKRTFVSCPKFDIFPRDKFRVFGQNRRNFEVSIFYLFMLRYLGVSSNSI